MLTRLVLADDTKEFRQYLRVLLDKDPGFTVLGEAEDGQAAIRLARELEPDIVIMDVAMPTTTGIEATRQIVASLPRIKVLALSVHADRRFVEAMLDAGASGYVLKDDMLTELSLAIHTVIRGQMYVSPGIEVGSDPSGELLPPRAEKINEAVDN
jgi:two-component system, NarL family, response regulator NreC